MTATFTSADGRSAYIAKALKPRRGTFGLRLVDGVFTHYPHREACALGAMLIGEACPPALDWSGDFSVHDVGKKMFGVDVEKFYQGFDGLSSLSGVNAEDPDYLLGGACWEAVKDLVGGPVDAERIKELNRQWDEMSAEERDAFATVVLGPWLTERETP